MDHQLDGRVGVGVGDPLEAMELAVDVASQLVGQLEVS
jgi:hypothetical protein